MKLVSINDDPGYYSSVCTDPVDGDPMVDPHALAENLLPGWTSRLGAFSDEVTGVFGPSDEELFWGDSIPEPKNPSGL